MSEPTSSPDEVLARRYGRGRPGGREEDHSRAMWMGGLGVAVAITAGAVWFALADDAEIATTTAASFTVVDENNVTLTFNVERPDPSVALTCTAEATDASHAQVGARIFEVPSGSERDQTVTVSIVTFARAEQAQPIENSCFATSEIG